MNRDRIVTKLLSGRFFATVTVVTTYCLLMFGCLFLVYNGKLSMEAFLGLFAAFSAMAKGITDGYFSRTDRKQPTEEK